MVLMPDTGAEAAQAHCTELLRALMETHFSIRPGLKLRVSASVGLSTAPADGLTVHSVIGAADARMYAAKTNGRGHVRGA